MKKKFILLFLALAILSGCQEKKTITPDKADDTNSKVTVEDSKDTVDVSKVDDEKLNTNEDAEEDHEENSNDEIEINTSVEEEVKVLEKNSDYISLIKMSQTGASGKEIHVLEDLKGSIKNIVIPDIPNMEPNYNYLVFLMDSNNGDITLTDIERGLIKIESENNEYLSQLKELLYSPENDKN